MQAVIFCNQHVGGGICVGSCKEKFYLIKVTNLNFSTNGNSDRTRLYRPSGKCSSFGVPCPVVRLLLNLRDFI